MEKEYANFIITQFNLKRNWETDKNKKPVMTEEWMKHRLGLFMNYCFPSIVTQKCKDITWLVYFDVDTKEEYKQLFQQKHQEHPLFVPMYKSSFDTFKKELSDDILSFCKEQHKYVITTSLDNDDCLHEEAICDLNQTFAKQKYQPVNFRSGLSLQVEPFYSLAYYNDSKGPFPSVIEQIIPGQKLRTVCERAHNEYNLSEVIQLQKRDYWVQVVHLHNMINCQRGDITLNVNRLKGFHINIPQPLKLNKTLYYKWKVKHTLKKFVPKKFLGPPND